MPVFQAEAPCIVPSWDGDDRDNGKASSGPHYSDPASLPTYDDGSGRASFHKGCGGTLIFALDGFCMACEAEGLGDEDHEARTVVPRTLDAPCWAVSCDECEEGFGDEDGRNGLHFTSLAEAEQDLKAAGWVTCQDGRVFCPEDKPGDGAPEVPAVIPGQDALPGMGE